jgi:hypothetical protein
VLLWLLELIGLLLRDISTTKGDLTSGESKRHEIKFLRSRGKVWVREEEKQIQQRTGSLYTIHI